MAQPKDREREPRMPPRVRLQREELQLRVHNAGNVLQAALAELAAFDAKANRKENPHGRSA
jgi:hypothetical protein